jgi:hypothetical protein
MTTTQSPRAQSPRTKSPKTKPSRSKPEKPAKAPPLEVRQGIAPPVLVAERQIELALIDIPDRHDRMEQLLDAERIDEVARSMVSVGQLQQIGVVAVGERFRLVYGRRRVMAARRLGWTSIAARVWQYESEAHEISAREVENIQREDLNPIEEAIAIARLLEMAVTRIAGERGYTEPPAKWSQGLHKSVNAEAVIAVAGQLGTGPSSPDSAARARSW